MYCQSIMENAGVKCYTAWLVVTRLCNTHSLVECKNYARSAKGLGANWPTKLLQHMHSATP